MEVAVRAADFYGPDASTSVISAYGVARFLAGKPALVPYRRTIRTTSRTCRTSPGLSSRSIDAPDDAYGKAWHVPHAPTRTLRDVLALAAARVGVKARVMVLPRGLAAIAGLFKKEIAEVAEMRFQWDRPYLVDSSKFAARFWSDATPFDKGLDATVAYYRPGSPGGDRLPAGGRS